MSLKSFSRYCDEISYYLKYNIDYIFSPECRDRYKKQGMWPATEESDKADPISESVFVPNPEPVSVERNTSSGADYISLMNKCAELVKEVDVFAFRAESQEAKSVCSVVAHHIIEDMSTSSSEVQLISNDTFYNALHHDAVPFGIVDDGAVIAETLRPGIKIGKRVFVRAKVRMADSQDASSPNESGSVNCPSLDEMVPEQNLTQDSSRLKDYKLSGCEIPRYEQVHGKDNTDDDVGSFIVSEDMNV